MAQQSNDAVIGEFQSRGDDFLHLKNSTGSIVGGIDNTGTGFGAMQGGFVPPPTKVLYVDGNRTDSYTADGSLLKPFVTITDAVNQISDNGDNSSNSYVVNVSPAVYAETIDLSSPALTNITFIGYGATISSEGSGDIVRSIGNDNLTDVKFVGFKLVAVLSGGFTFSSTTNGTNFLSGAVFGEGLWFEDCFIHLNSGSFSVTNAGLVFMNESNWTGACSFNNVGLVSVRTSIINTSGTGWSANTNGANPEPAGFGGTQLDLRWVQHAAAIAIGAGSVSNIQFSRLVISYTVSGAATVRGSSISTIVVNSGGQLTESDSSHGSLTVNAGGTYVSTSDTTATGALTLSGAAPTTPTEIVGLGNGTAVSATAGAQTLPANPAGFLIVNIGGTVQKIPYYNS